MGLLQAEMNTIKSLFITFRTQMLFIDSGFYTVTVKMISNNLGYLVCRGSCFKAIFSFFIHS